MEMEKVSVVCKKGQSVPRENIREPWLNDTENDPVPLTSYYRRLIDDGSLILKPEAKRSAKKAEGV